MAASNTATSTTALRFTHSATTPHKLPHFTEKWKALFFCAEHISVKAAAKKYGRKGERKRRRRRRRSKTCKAGKGEKKMAQCSALSFFFRQLCFSITSRPRNLCPQTQQQARPRPPPQRRRRQCRRQRGEERPCVSTRETLTHCPFFFLLLSFSRPFPSLLLN